MTVSEILHIIEVSENVAHAVTREWETVKGEKRQRTYPARRFSPKHIQKIHDTLLTLHDRKVVIRRNSKQRREVADRIVHILDSFGYVYKCDGEMLDLDDLPPGNHKFNIGTEDRPVFRVCKTTGAKKSFRRPIGVLFRLNGELADELTNKKKGTIGYTLFARKVFGLLRQHIRHPAAIRLILLILRQTDKEFTRNIGPASEGLGWDVTHPKRAAAECEKILLSLKGEGLVVDFDLDPGKGKLWVKINRGWYREGA